MIPIAIATESTLFERLETEHTLFFSKTLLMVCGGSVVQAGVLKCLETMALEQLERDPATKPNLLVDLLELGAALQNVWGQTSIQKALSRLRARKFLRWFDKNGQRWYRLEVDLIQAPIKALEAELSQSLKQAS